MTYLQFLARLRKTPRQWRLNAYGRLRLLNRNHCPLSAVAKTLSCDVFQARTRLDIDVDLAYRLASAADFDYHDPMGRRMRRALLRACGVTT